MHTSKPRRRSSMPKGVSLVARSQVSRHYPRLIRTASSGEWASMRWSQLEVSVFSTSAGKIKVLSLAMLWSPASRGVSSIGIRPYYSNPFIPAHGSFFVMGPVNSAIVRRSWALFRAQQRMAPEADTVSYGDDFTYSESQVFDKKGGLGSRFMAWVVGLLLTIGLAAIMKSRIVRRGGRHKTRN